MLFDLIASCLIFLAGLLTPALYYFLGGNIVAPTVETISVAATGPTTAQCAGKIVDAGGGTITARGVCWAQHPNPTIGFDETAEPIMVQGGYFECRLSGLSAGTTYHVRAYATNGAGTGYGVDVTFRTLRVNKKRAYIGVGLRAVGL